MIKQLIPWIAGALYVISPYDLIPDMFVGPGWIDDLVVLGLAYWWYSRKRQAFGPGTTFRGGRRKATGSGGPRRGNTFSSAEQQEDDPYVILGVQPGATKEEIRKAYMKAAAQYHPDKVQHLGEEFQKLAHEKFVAIQKAYDTLIK